MDRRADMTYLRWATDKDLIERIPTTTVAQALLCSGPCGMNPPLVQMALRVRHERPLPIALGARMPLNANRLHQKRKRTE